MDDRYILIGILCILFEMTNNSLILHTFAVWDKSFDPDKYCNLKKDWW